MLATIKVFACKKENPTKLNKFSNGAARVWCAGLESAFVKLDNILFYFLFSMNDLWLAKDIHLKIIIDNYTI